VPQVGVLRILAPQPGVVVQVPVQEGEDVVKGAPLVVLSTDVHSEARGATLDEVVQRLMSRRASMAAERGRHQQLYEQETQNLFKRLTGLRLEMRHVEAQIALQNSVILLSQRVVERQQWLNQRGLAPAQHLEEAQENSLEQTQKLRELERSRITLQQQDSALETELRELPIKSQTQLAEIDRSVAALDQDLAEAEARRQIVITAPQSGTVSGIQIEPGGSAGTNVPLLSIVPTGSKLEAQLFSPSRAIGFVRPGQRVLLRYEAFPYQKFGTYEGTVANVSRSAVSPSELPQQLSGLTSLFGANEPVYRITVVLTRQTAIAYGKSVPLQSGMRLEADVLMETRRLFEWVLDPVFTLTGKWRK
jgi:membrane fusion protein